MGLTMSFTRVTPEELERAVHDQPWAMKLVEFLGELDDPGEPAGNLDKSWDGLQYLLDRAGVGVRLQDDGVPINEDHTIAGWRVDNVRQTAELLRATPFEELAGFFDPAEMTEHEVYPSFWDADDLEYLRGNYQTLVEFFEATAGAKSAAIMEFG